MKTYIATIEVMVHADSDAEAARKAVMETKLMHANKGNNANLQHLERTVKKWYQSSFVNIAKLLTKK